MLQGILGCFTSLGRDVEKNACKMYDVIDALLWSDANQTYFFWNVHRISSKWVK